MIYEITKEIATELIAKGYPFPVVYGPERGSVAFTHPRIVIERDRQGSDPTKAPKARTPNPKMMFVRGIACVCRIFAKSNLPGAGVHDHERQADQAADKLTIALFRAIRLRFTECEIQPAKLMSASDLKFEGLESWPGVVYEIKFSVDRGVFDTNWVGEKAPETVLTAENFGNTTVLITGSTAGNNVMPTATTEID